MQARFGLALVGAMALLWATGCGSPWQVDEGEGDGVGGAGGEFGEGAGGSGGSGANVVCAEASSARCESGRCAIVQ